MTVTFVRICSRCGATHARPGDVHPLTSAEAVARLAECAERAAQPAYVHPKPEVPARVATADELAPVARSAGARMRLAREHGWEVRALYARGWEIKATRTHLSTGALTETIIVQFGMAGEWRRAVAAWSCPVAGPSELIAWTFELIAHRWRAQRMIAARKLPTLINPKWKFQFAYRWGADLPVRALTAAGLADHLKGSE